MLALGIGGDLGVRWLRGRCLLLHRMLVGGIRCRRRVLGCRWGFVVAGPRRWSSLLGCIGGLGRLRRISLGFCFVDRKFVCRRRWRSLSWRWMFRRCLRRLWYIGLCRRGQGLVLLRLMSWLCCLDLTGWWSRLGPASRQGHRVRGGQRVDTWLDLLFAGMYRCRPYRYRHLVKAQQTADRGM